RLAAEQATGKGWRDRPTSLSGLPNIHYKAPGGCRYAPTPMGFLRPVLGFGSRLVPSSPNAEFGLGNRALPHHLVTFFRQPSVVLLRCRHLGSEPTSPQAPFMASGHGRRLHVCRAHGWSLAGVE